MRQHAALAAALLIGAQLLLGYWFYGYLIWFYPLLLVAVIQPPREHRDAGTLMNSAGRIGVLREVQMLPAAVAGVLVSPSATRTAAATHPGDA